MKAEMFFIPVMKDKREEDESRNVLHTSDDGHKGRENKQKRPSYHNEGRTFHN
ncbi:hypothetical protein [Metabacillus halosaccharovorans]|uniref:hypothetical protein n=1 Tax=Metabacillus halosaccharovorans TaxID=930124 RepID=UPI001C1F8696|nr:hypothetical protein [Metabacillus halosaccharovorans]